MCGEKNEKHHFDSDRNNQKTIEHGQTVKLHLATRTKILGSDTFCDVVRPSCEGPTAAGAVLI